MASLQAERDALVGGGGGGGAGRLRELEAELGAQRRRVAEQERLLRVRGAGDRRVQQLCGEIEGMKAARVQLLRRLKAEADRFRDWRTSHQREVAALRRQGQLQQTQLGRLQEQLARQQAVMRRRMEEAAAAQQRARGLAERQAAARAQRQGMSAAAGVARAEAAAEVAEAEAAAAGGEEAEAWLMGEVAACAAVRRLRGALEERLELRRQLSGQAQDAEAALRAAEAAEAADGGGGGGGGAGGDAIKERLARVQRSWQRRAEGGGGGGEDRAALRARAEALRAQVAACSGAIAQLQRQLLESSSGGSGGGGGGGSGGGDERERLAALSAHPSLRSPGDLRRAVRALFAACVAESVRAADLELAAADGREEAARHAEAARTARAEAAEAAAAHRREALLAEQAAAERSLALLSQMAGAARRLAAGVAGRGGEGEGEGEAGEAEGGGGGEGAAAAEALRGIVAQLDAQQGSIGELAAMREEQARERGFGGGKGG